MPAAPPTAQPSRAHTLGRAHPLTLVMFGAFCYAVGPVMAAGSTASGPVFSFWRLWFGVVAFGGLLAIRAAQGHVPPLDRASLRVTALAGGLFGIHQLLFFSALKAASVADVTLMGTLGPLVVGVGAAVLFGERPGVRFRAWSLVAILGSAGVVFGATTGPTGSPLGMGLALVNVIAFAAFFLVSKQSRSVLGVVPFLFGVITVAAVTVTAFVLATGETLGPLPAGDYWLAAGVAVGPGLVGHLAMTWPLRWVPANIPPVIRLGQPVVSALLAWAFLAQMITWFHVVGGAVTLVGVAGALLTGPRSGSDATVAPRN